MMDVNALLSRLPVYSRLNMIYAGGDRRSYESPDLNYYKLQYIHRYRFPQVKRQEDCDCPSCKVAFIVVYPL